MFQYKKQHKKRHTSASYLSASRFCPTFLLFSRFSVDFSSRISLLVQWIALRTIRVIADKSICRLIFSNDKFFCIDGNGICLLDDGN